MIWTDEAVEELRKMWDRGMTTGQIAKALNVTKNSIIGKVHRLCLTARPSPIKKTPTKTASKSGVEQAVSSTVKEKKVTSGALNSEKAIPAPEVVIAEANVETNIPLIKLDNHSCRWPLGDPKDDDFCFCGKKVRTGQTYCDEHANIAYVRTNKKI